MLETTQVAEEAKCRECGAPIRKGLLTRCSPCRQRAWRIEDNWRAAEQRAACPIKAGSKVHYKASRKQPKEGRMTGTVLEVFVGRSGKLRARVAWPDSGHHRINGNNANTSYVLIERLDLAE